MDHVVFPPIPLLAIKPRQRRDDLTIECSQLFEATSSTIIEHKPREVWSIHDLLVNASKAPGGRRVEGCPVNPLQSRRGGLTVPPLNATRVSPVQHSTFPMSRSDDGLGRSLPSTRSRAYGRGRRVHESQAMLPSTHPMSLATAASFESTLQASNPCFLQVPLPELTFWR